MAAQIPTEKITIFTLDYGKILNVDTKDPIEDRVEYSVVYYSENWKSLVDLLNDPRGFAKNLRKRVRMFDKERGRGMFNWKFVDGPITGVLVNGYDDLENSRAVIRSVYGDDKVNLSDAEVKDTFTQGAFIVEFAIDTRSLLITYWPPKNRKVYYSGSFSPIIVASVNTNMDAYSSFHVDLDKGADKRAEFCVSLIEDYQATAKAMAKHGSKSGDVTFGAQPMTDLPPRASAQRTPTRPALTIERPKPEKDVKDFSIEFDLSKGVPVLVVEGLGENLVRGKQKVVRGCCHIKARRNGHSLIAGPITIKCYKFRPIKPRPRRPKDGHKS